MIRWDGELLPLTDVFIRQHHSCSLFIIVNNPFTFPDVSLPLFSLSPLHCPFSYFLHFRKKKKFKWLKPSRQRLQHDRRYFILHHHSENIPAMASSDTRGSLHRTVKYCKNIIGIYLPTPQAPKHVADNATNSPPPGRDLDRFD